MHGTRLALTLSVVIATVKIFAVAEVGQLPTENESGSNAVVRDASSVAWPVSVLVVPAYVITLRRTPERFGLFTSAGSFSILPRLVRHDAIDGNTLTPADDNRISIAARLNIQRGTRRAHADLVTLGMAGLYLSHVEVWQRFLAETTDAVAIVLEDDAVITEGLPARMDAALRRLPPPDTWDVWVLGALAVTSSSPSHEGTRDLHDVTSYSGTQAYVVTRRGAARLVALSLPMEAQIDAFMSHVAELGLVRVLWFADGSVHVPQGFRLLVSGGSTVQSNYCDLCDLPHNYNRTLDVSTWLVVGIAVAIAMQIASARGLLNSIGASVARCSALLRRCSRNTVASARAEKQHVGS